MLGLNQVVMQTLAMAVIASLVGASGLGQKLLYSLQQLKLGAAVEQGIAIVLIAVVLDRLTQAYARRDAHKMFGASWMDRHKHLFIFIAVLIIAFIASSFFRELAVLPKKYTFTLGKELDVAVRAFSKNAYPYICLLYTSPSPRDLSTSRMPSSA